MFRTLKGLSRILLLAVMVFATTACEPKAGLVEFCDSDAPPWAPYKMEIRLDHNLVVVADASSRVEVLETNDAIGFVTPFPLAIPKRAELRQWTLGGYVFTAEPSEGGIAISTEPGPLQQTIVHFNPKRGVTSLCEISTFDACDDGAWRVCRGQLNVEALQRMRAFVPDE